MVKRMKPMKHKWTIQTSISVFEYCLYTWRGTMYPHLDGFKNPDNLRVLFFYYLNYGMTGNEMNLQE